MTPEILKTCAVVMCGFLLIALALAASRAAGMAQVMDDDGGADRSGLWSVVLASAGWLLVLLG